MSTDLGHRRSALRRQVQQDYAQLRQAMENLSEAVQDRTDLARRVRQQPYAWLGGALGIGIALGFVQGSLS